MVRRYYVVVVREAWTTIRAELSAHVKSLVAAILIALFGPFIVRLLVGTKLISPGQAVDKFVADLSENLLITAALVLVVSLMVIALAAIRAPAQIEQKGVIERELLAERVAILTQPSMSANHLAELQQYATDLRVELERFRYAKLTVEGAVGRKFGAHFPDLIRSLAELNAAVDGAREATPQIEQRIKDVLATRGLGVNDGQPGGFVELLTMVALSYIPQREFTWRVDERHELRVDYETPASLVRMLNYSDQPFAKVAQLREILHSVEDWPEVQSQRESEFAITGLRDSLLYSLDEIQHDHNLEPAPTCSSCAVSGRI